MSFTSGAARVGRLACGALQWGAAVLATLWAAGALYFDFPLRFVWMAMPLLLLAALALRLVGDQRRAVWIPLAGAMLVLVWWPLLQPSHDRPWQTDVSRLPWAEIEGESVTIHEVRNFDYPRGADPVPRWETRPVALGEITGVDLAVNYWGSPWIAHPIIIFRFRDAPPLSFSIETRREQGEEYSALAGFFRRYELIVLAGEERDLLRVRTNRRVGEDVYLYATTITPARARERFLEYVETMNDLRARARWYNAVTSNCTTAIRGMQKDHRMPFDWRLLINGLGDQMLYERDLLRADGLSFVELKAQARINEVALTAQDSPDFSGDIRRGRAGFAR